MASKEQVKDYILRLINEGEKRYAAKTAETFSLSRSTVYNYISELVKDRVITKNAEGKYKLVDFDKTFVYVNTGLDEDRIFQKDVLPILNDLDQNVIDIWRYAFTEMMNNAIEHSESEKILFRVQHNELETTIDIRDHGVGIFKKIRDFMLNEKGEELSLVECMSLLFTGKFTTAREYHSGEGIFFTSHLMDRFYILSDELMYTRDNFSDDYAGAEFIKVGTMVTMSLSNKSHKTVQGVFDQYTNPDEGFHHTSVPIAHIFPGGSPVSRSEARRLGAMLTNFKEATLDFTGVSSIGQAFTHELFVVWQRQNLGMTLYLKGMSQNVENMIKRVLVDANKV